MTGPHLTLRRAAAKARRLIDAWRLSRRHAGDDPGSPPSDRPLEVLIPVIAKDLETLPLCVASIRRFVRHPVRRIRLVCRADDADVIAAAAKLDVDVLDEASLLSPAARDVRFQVGGRDRSGWIKQQLVKLGGDAAVETDRFLVVDADTAFVRDMTFCRGDRDLLFCSDEYHRPYFDAYRRLTGIDRRYPLSFVAHHMLFNRALLAALRARIESHTGKAWDQAILDLLDPAVASGFSEYETYGNFCTWTHGDAVDTRYWHNRASATPVIPPLDEAVERYGRRYYTVSFHSYLRAPARPPANREAPPAR